MELRGSGEEMARAGQGKRDLRVESRRDELAGNPDALVADHAREALGATVGFGHTLEIEVLQDALGRFEDHDGLLQLVLLQASAMGRPGVHGRDRKSTRLNSS